MNFIAEDEKIYDNGKTYVVKVFMLFIDFAFHFHSLIIQSDQFLFECFSLGDSFIDFLFDELIEFDSVFLFHHRRLQ